MTQIYLGGLKHLLEAELIKQLSENTKINPKYKPTIDAYSDFNDISGANRDLDFLDRSWLSAKEWKECMSLAVPTGYNYFNAQKVGNVLIKEFSHLKYKTAREGSVCLYATKFINNDDLVDFIMLMAKAKAEEVSIDNYEPSYDLNITLQRAKLLTPDKVKNAIVRVWWD